MYMAMNRNVSWIIITSSLGLIANYHVFTYIYILIGRLLIGILANVQMSVTYKHSKSSPEVPCSYLFVYII